jgi:Ca2+-binding EF-hand superfamily protein
MDHKVFNLRMKAAKKVGNRETLADMERQFRLMDLDGNGELDVEEFCTGLSEGEFEMMTREQAGVLFRALDADGNGTLDFKEFIEMQKKSMELAQLMKFDTTEENETHADMERQFRLMDRDGDGELDIEEFCSGLSKGEFEMMTREQAEVLFHALDADGNGTLDFKEFIEMQRKNAEFIEMRKLNTEQLQTLVQAEKVKLMKAIEEGGVRLQRTNSVVADPKLQGDIRMMAPAMVRKRKALQTNPELEKVIRRWWDSAQLGGADCVMHKEVYIQINMAIHFMLVPGVIDSEAEVTAEKDWYDDIAAHEPPGATSMQYSSFYDAMFELCDTWVETTEEDDYMGFVDEMIEAHEEYKENLRMKAEARAGDAVLEAPAEQVEMDEAFADSGLHFEAKKARAMDGLSKDGKAAMLNVMEGLDSQQKVQIINVGQIRARCCL